jgi:hypothetical protein
MRRQPEAVICSIPGCEDPRYQRLYCRRHYFRWYRHGNPLGGATSRGPWVRSEPNWRQQAIGLGVTRFPRDPDGIGRERHAATA